MAKGDVDAACVWQPLLDNVKKGTPDGKLLGLDSDTPNFKKFGTMASPDIMIISRKLVDEQPDLARKLTAAIFKGVEYTNANPEDTADDGGALLPQAARGSAGGDEDLQIFRRGGLAATHETPLRADAVPGAVAVRQWQDPERCPDTAKWENTSFIPKP